MRKISKRYEKFQDFELFDTLRSNISVIKSYKVRDAELSSKHRKPFEKFHRPRPQMNSKRTDMKRIRSRSCSKASI